LLAAVAYVMAFPSGAQMPAAVGSAEEGDEVVVGEFQPQRRKPAAAAAAVYRLLSPVGSIELAPGENRLVIRDRGTVVEHVLTRLAELDRTARALAVVVQIVRADVAAVPPVSGEAPELPQRVFDRLRDLLRYRSYRLLARAELEAYAEIETTRNVGRDYQVAFELEDAVRSGQLRVRGFRLLRRTGGGAFEPMIHTHLSLEIGKPLILGLSGSEASREALMVVLEASERTGSRS
jgi:hypothetical protein